MTQPYGKEPCPCGHRSCKKFFLTGIGSFVQGSGFSEAEADLILSALHGQASARAIVEACAKVTEEYATGPWGDEGAIVATAIRAKASEIIAALPKAGEVVNDVRKWFHYPIEMPLTADGQGPATIGKDAAKMTYEVWDQHTDSHGSFEILPDAINEAMRLNATTPSVIPAAAVGANYYTDCPRCGGYGGIGHGDATKCPDCHGNGVVKVAIPTPSEGLTERYREAEKLLAAIKAEADRGNEVIRLNRHRDGQGMITVATAMHRIAAWSAKTLATPEKDA